MADLPYPYFGTPQDSSNWLDAQRKQQIAQMLMGSLQSANQTPADWNQMKVVPKRGALQTVSALADALMAKKGIDASNAATANYMNPQPQQQPATPAPAPPADSGQTFNGPTGGINVPGQAPPSGNVQQPQSPPQQQQDPMIPPGMSRERAAMFARMPGGMEALTKLSVGNYMPLEVTRQLHAAGIDPNGPQGQAIQQQIIAKAAADRTPLKQGETLLEHGQPTFTAPDNGIQTNWGTNGPSQSEIPGSAAAIQAIAKAKTTGAQTATPIKLGTDVSGKDIYGYPAAPGSGAPNATAPGQTASPADVAAAKKGAESGVDFASNMAANAAGATDLRRGLAELTNLSQQATPSAANAMKLKTGAAMIAMGADPAWVSKASGIDIGALSAAEHTSGGIAVSAIHQMTNRGTNFDMETFMKQNPNLNMADPAAFKRVVEYMDSKAKDTIGQQKEFSQWVPQARRQGVSPQDYETQFTAHWLDKQNQAIDAGKTNSARPGALPVIAPADLQAEMQRRGLIKPPPQ